MGESQPRISYESSQSVQWPCCIMPLTEILLPCGFCQFLFVSFASLLLQCKHTVAALIGILLWFSAAWEPKASVYHTSTWDQEPPSPLPGPTPFAQPDAGIGHLR